MRRVIAAAILVATLAVPVPPAGADAPALPMAGPIAFDGAGPNSREIFTMNVDGSARTQLTDNTVTDMQPTWSPGATRIAFARKVPHWGYEIFVMNADGTQQARVTYHKGDDVEPSWSLASNQIGFAGNQGGDFEIYTVRPSGRRLKQLTDNAANDRDPAWMADCSCQQILFETDRSGNSDIYGINPDRSFEGPSSAVGPGDQTDPAAGPSIHFYFVDQDSDGSHLAYSNGSTVTPVVDDTAVHAAPAVALGENVLAEVRTGLGGADGIYVGEDRAAWGNDADCCWPSAFTRIGVDTDRNPALPLQDSSMMSRVNLLHALAVADQVKTDTGSYGDTPPGLLVSMAGTYPAFVYSSGSSDSYGPIDIGVASAGASHETVGLAAFAHRAVPPVCYYISETSGVVTYGSYSGADASTTCSGNDALAGATNPSW